MLRISKNIKKIALSLLVVGLAISTQAFKNSEKETSNFAITYYALNEDGSFYRKIGTSDPSTLCTSGPELPCVLRYNDEIDPDGFASDNVPNGGTVLGSEGYVPE